MDPISFVIPRASENAKYFADDLYPPARSNEPSCDSPKEWLDGRKAEPKRVSLNKANVKPFSQRPEEESNAMMKRGIQMADTRRQQQEKEEEEKRKKEEAFNRMQNLAFQHEKHNPNLSTGGDKFNKASVGDVVPAKVAGDEVKEDEW